MKKSPSKPIKKTPKKGEQPAHLAAIVPGDRGPRKNPKERLAANPTSLRAAINAKCYDCNGEENWVFNTRHCVCPDCPLFNVRPFRSKEVVDS